MTLACLWWSTGVAATLAGQIHHLSNHQRHGVDAGVGLQHIIKWDAAQCGDLVKCVTRLDGDSLTRCMAQGQVEVSAVCKVVFLYISGLVLALKGVRNLSLQPLASNNLQRATHTAYQTHNSPSSFLPVPVGAGAACREGGGRHTAARGQGCVQDSELHRA